MPDKYTNVSRRPIHFEGGMMVPGEPMEVPPELLESPVFKAYMEKGDVKKGEAEVRSELEDEEENTDPPLVGTSAVPKEQAKPTGPQPAQKK